MRSKAVVIVALVIFALALLIGTFSVGLAIGYHKARFSYSWGENYHRNFGGPKNGFMGDMLRGFAGRDLIDAHGTSGQIVKIDGSTLVIKGRDNVEKIVLVKGDTAIMRLRNPVAVSDLQVNENVVVIGQPNPQGQIEAKFIRVMPMPTFSPAVSTTPTIQ